MKDRVWGVLGESIGGRGGGETIFDPSERRKRSKELRPPHCLARQPAQQLGRDPMAALLRKCTHTQRGGEGA